MGVTGIHEFYFSKNTSETSHVSWEDYDYEYKSEAYMLDREFTKHGRHPPIVERPIPRVENMTEFYNPTHPSNFRNGSLVRKRRVYFPHELRPARTVGGTMGLNQGPAYFTRSRSSPVRRPRSYYRSPSKTPDRRRSCSKSPSRSPVRCPSIRSCTRSWSTSYARSRSQSPSYSQTPPQQEPYIPIWKRQVNMLPDYQKHFIRNVVSRLRGMPNLDNFFDICGVPQYVWKHTQEDSKIEPAEVAEYSAIEQAIGTWWISNKTKPLYWIVDQIQAGFEELNIGRFFRDMLQRHPQMDLSYHEIQLDLPGDSQAYSRDDLPPPRNITVEYAEKQMSQKERHLLHMLSTFTNRPACVDEIAVATSLDASALLNKQAIYHDPKRAEQTTYEYIAYHILITWYASSSKTQTEKLCKLRDIYYAMGYAKNFDMYLADSKFELPRMEKGGKAKQTPSMGVSVQERQNSFSPSSQISSGPNGENIGKRILEIDGGQTSENNGDEQLIAFGEATVEDVGIGTERNSRTVTFELSQRPEDTTSPPPLISSDNASR